MTEAEKIELKSDEMQEILSRTPHALVRWGISAISVVILMIFIGSFFFTYPDIQKGEIVITTENPPVRIVAKSTGKIKELYCKEKDAVEKGQLLAVVDNPSITKDIQRVKVCLSNTIVNDTSSSIHPELLIDKYELGAIQTSYSQFIKAATSYLNFISLKLQDHEKKALQINVSGKKAYISGIQKQLNLKKKEFGLAEKAYQREIILHQKGTISKAEIEKAEQDFLSVQQSVAQYEISLTNNQTELKQFEESLSKLSVQTIQEKENLLTVLKTAKDELVSSIESWEQTYLLVSPEAGIITFNEYWNRNQFVNAGENVFIVISHNPGNLVGRVKVHDSGFGKIKQGQLVNIKVSGYPYMEYGLLRGIIQNTSLVANDRYYFVEVKFPTGLKTTSHKSLHFSGELIGEANIITENRSLAYRFLEPIKYLLSNYLVKD